LANFFDNPDDSSLELKTITLWGIVQKISETTLGKPRNCGKGFCIIIWISANVLEIARRLYF